MKSRKIIFCLDPEKSDSSIAEKGCQNKNSKGTQENNLKIITSKFKKKMKK